MKAGFGMVKHTMELVWHSCEECPPEEDYNPCLYVTDGHVVMPMRWTRDPSWCRFERGGWYIEAGVNAEGYWWADLVQTVNGFAPLQTVITGQRSRLEHTTLNETLFDKGDGYDD